MNADINYLGTLKLLRLLCDAGLITKAEMQKIAARVANQSGAKIIVFP
jgi:hypothetical protein